MSHRHFLACLRELNCIMSCEFKAVPIFMNGTSADTSFSKQRDIIVTMSTSRSVEHSLDLFIVICLILWIQKVLKKCAMRRFRSQLLTMNEWDGNAGN
jgi:hypothetical protein